MNILAGLEGLIGAVIGAGAAIAVVIINGRAEERHAKKLAQEKRVQAARAWRDDLFEVQAALAKAYVNGTRPDLRRAARSRMGTTSTFLELTEAIEDGDEWWKVARGRRELIELLEIRQDVRRWKESSIHYFYWQLEQAREVIAGTDPRWPYHEHPYNSAMGRPPRDCVNSRVAR